MLSLHRTIRDIGVEEWNDLSGENAFATHGWLLTVETQCRARIQPLYFSLSQDGVLVAASVCYVIDPTDEMETLDHMLLGRLRGAACCVGLGFLPAVVCGPLMGYGWHLGVRPELNAADALKARQQLLDAIETEAHTLRLQVAFVHILNDEAELKNLLQERGYLRCRNAPLAVLDLTWSSFDDYLAGFTSKRRGEFRRQISRNQEAGNLVDFHHPSCSDESRLHQLLDVTAKKHNPYPFPFGPAFLSELKRNLGPQAWIVTARKADQTTGVCIAIVHNKMVFPFTVGVDYDVAGDDYTYFQLVYNSMIGRAIDAGMRGIYYGRGVYSVKLRRGCRLTDTWIYSRESGPRRLASAPWFRVASMWNRYKLPSAARQLLKDA